MSSQHRLVIPVLAVWLIIFGARGRFDAAQAQAGANLKTVVAGLHGLSLHDQCTGEFAAQPDTCIHQQLLERSVTVGGKPGEVHNVTLRVQGIFEPTIIEGGETPLAAHPYYKVGGTIRARDWSAWHIEVSNPKQTYWLNHYPKVSHTIYKEDFEATIPMATGATVTVRVVDGNDRQMDNAEEGRPDRLQIIKELSEKPLPGQMLRLEVVRVAPAPAAAAPQGGGEAAPQGRGGAPGAQGRGGGRGGDGGASNLPAPPPIDRQVVRDQDNMTWDDYKPIPDVNWATDTRAPSERTIKIAMVLFDFEDQPFVVTLPKRSDPFGNPQIDPIKREDVPKYYHDFWNKPQPANHGRSVHEYWMELSHGRIGVEFTPFGPYRLEGSYVKTHGNAEVADKAWRAAAGEEIRKGFDLVMRIYAGYDETTVWQEFGEMKFQTRDDIKPPFCNPVDPKQCWLDTRYTDWTSWLAGSYLWSNSAINMGESSGSIRHEISHAAFRIGDNNNNPYVTPYRRVGAGAWDVMDRGSFNGPGGPHRRWLIPVTEGGAAPAGLLLRQRMYFKFTGPGDVLSLNREGLAQSGLAVGRVTARAHKPLPNELTGILVRLDGDAPQDRTPPSDPATNPLSQGVQNYNSYTLEVVQRIGYDSFTPGNGVLITKNKDQASAAGGPNSFNIFNWIIDANPQDIQVPDFKRPNGEVVMRTIADYRQLNDATFHAGLNSGSEYEWVDLPNRLHFYVVDVHRAPNGLLSYTLGVRSIDGAGPHQRGLTVTAPTAAPAARDGRVDFILNNTGKRAATAATLHPEDASRYLDSDIYRISVSVQGSGWAAQLQNALAAVPFGGKQAVPVFLSRTPTAAESATVTVRAASESDPTKKVVTTYVVAKSAVADGEVMVRVETNLGNIDLAIDTARAPITAGNFLKYVDGGFYDGGRVHRATRVDNYKTNLPNRPLLEIIQADINPGRNGDRFPAIPLERTSVTGLTHIVGTVSMPRGDAADTGRSGFVIHLNDQPSLNHGGMRFDDGQGTAAFGRVVAGLEVARTIQKQPIKEQALTPPIEIKRVYRLRGQGQ